MDPLPCPICGHQFVRKIHSHAVLHADEERVEQDKAQRQVVWQSKAPSVQGKSPHIGKVMVQQYYCIYFQRPGNCNCATGPFNDADREWLKDWHNEWLEDRMGAPPTVSDNVSSFVDHLMFGSLTMGDRDILDVNGDRSPENIQGSAVEYVNHSVVDDNKKHEFGQLTGVRTSKLPDSSAIGFHQ